MWKLACVIALCLMAFPLFGQSTLKYQVATILSVKPHQESGVRASDLTSYDVTLRVGDTVYVALYTPQAGQVEAKYAAGRDLLVYVGKQTISYNDILGRSFEVPIESQRPVALAKAGPQ